MDSIEMKTLIPAMPSEVYEAWLDGTKHGAMTGGEATGTAEEGTEYTAWDGYISGKNLALTPNKEIVQSWRSTEFEPEDADSHLLIQLAEKNGQTELTLIHTQIPAGEGKRYEDGWIKHYFTPMKAYFSEQA